LVVLMVAMSAV